MIINRSSKYNAKREFWHNGRQVMMTRIWGGIAFHGVPKFITLIGEEDYFGDKNFYLIAEGSLEAGEGLTDIINLAVRMTAEYGVKRWFGRLDENISETLTICNKLYYNSGVRTLTVTEVPRIGEYIDENVSLIHMLTRNETKRLYFFGEAMCVGEIKSLPIKDARAKDFPRATALSNVLAGLLKYQAEKVAPEDLVPPPESWY